MLALNSSLPLFNGLRPKAFQSFKKQERLTGKKAIDQIFKTGSTFLHYPFKVIWTTCQNVESRYPARVLIGVSKKYHRRATDRNRIKRRIREAYRKNKSPFYDFLTRREKQCSLVLLYISKETFTFIETEKKISEILIRLQQQIR
ncbi:MAG: ribonuclease P protein component [Bacteroidetes bacterium]|nr:ribonuclease P protein component [Bacteroidota bacterium]